MSSDSRQKEKPAGKAWQRILSILFFVVVGAAAGFLVALYADTQLAADAGFLDLALSLVGLLVPLAVAIVLQTIIHEAGHLVFGLVSGYRFSSFRIGSFMWVKTDEGIVLKRLSIAGTGGQCLMAPPDLADGKIPVVLYNLGGSLANLIASAASLAFCLALTSAHATLETAGFSLADVLFNFLLMMAVVGFAFALINGIPLRVGGLDNDGHNAWELARNKEAARAFWMQMKVNEQLSKNVRLKDMPDEWFAVPSDDAMRNSIIAAVGVFACNRHMDAHRFDEAESLIRHLLESSCNMAGLHRNLLVCDLVYLKLIGNNGLEAPEELDDLLNAEQRQFMKSMKDFPSVIRTEYALALLQERDAEKASAALAHFESIAKRYPYPTDIESEREYVQIASEQALRNGQPS